MKALARGRKGLDKIPRGLEEKKEPQPLHEYWGVELPKLTKAKNKLIQWASGGGGGNVTSKKNDAGGETVLLGRNPQKQRGDIKQHWEKIAGVST